MPPVYDDSQAEQIARRAAKLAVEQFVASPAYAEAMKKAVDVRLETLGIDTENPASTRRDMQALRDWTHFWEEVRKAGISATVKWLITGALAALVVGLTIAFHR